MSLAIPNMPATPDWMRSLLPDGGKVSLTIHGPQGATTGGSQPASVDPNTGVALPAGEQSTVAPQPQHVVAAMRQVGPASVNSGGGTGPVHTPGGGVINDPNGPMHPPTTGPRSKGYDPKAQANPTATGYNWWNPYHGAYEVIPGIDHSGTVTNANAFWAYYTHFPSAILDVFANKLATANSPSTWQHQYTDAEKQGMVTGTGDYITGLGGINQNRFNELLQYGDLTDAQAAAFGLTPDQVRAIRQNPVSDLNNIKRNLVSSIYGANASSASHGGYNSGARFNDVGNLESDAVRQQLDKKLALNTGLGSDNQAVTNLFRDIKDQMEKDGGFDPGDTEHNQKAWNDTHAVVKAAHDNAQKVLEHVGDWQTLKTVRDMRAAMKDMQTAYAQYGKLIDPRMAGQMKAIIDGLRRKIHDTVMQRSDVAHRNDPGVLTRTSVTAGPAPTTYPNTPPPNRPTKPIIAAMRKR